MARRRHNILKERLTGKAWQPRLEHGSRDPAPPQNRAEAGPRVAYLTLIRRPLIGSPHRSFMTFITSAQNLTRYASKDWRSHLLPIVLVGAIAVAALGLVTYLLWPTWEVDAAKGPARLPVSVGATLFNVPSASIRMKIQHHTGPQERIDLSFTYPSLEPPEASRHVSAADVDDAAMQPIDRIFLSLAAHHDALAPDMRARTIFPRYLDQAATSSEDGLTMRAFRDGSPYSGEDFFSASAPDFIARCSREAATPGMCLSERRIDGADLTFRFPRSWLAHWREVANAMDRLTQQLHGPK
jgi:hypothetical protein